MFRFTSFQARNVAAGLCLAGILAACSSDPTGPVMPSQLEGLTGGAIHDSVGTTPPPGPTTGTGQVRGTVLAPSEPGAGNDSLATAPRISGATITVYPVTSSSPLALGAKVATMTTGADGIFETPVLPAGDYVVTVEPSSADAAKYYGQYLRGPIHSGSIDYPWWVVLARR